MTIFLYQVLTGNSQIGNTPCLVWRCLIYGDWEGLGTNLSNEMLLNVSELLWEDQQKKGERGLKLPLPTQIRVNTSEMKWNFSELFKWFSTVPRLPTKLCLEERLFRTIRKRLGRICMKEFIKYMGTLNFFVNSFSRIFFRL